MDLNDYIPALRYGATIPTDANDITLSEGSIIVGDSSSNGQGVNMHGQANINSTGSVQLMLASGKIYIGNSSGLAQVLTPSGAWTISTLGVATMEQGVPFIATASVGTVASIAGVTLLADSVVTGIGATTKVYLQGFAIQNGSVAIEVTAGPVTNGFIIQDSAGTAFFTVLSSGSTLLNGNAFLALSSGTGKVTNGNAFALGAGGTAGKGLQVKLGTGTISSGATFTTTAWGIIK